jgi:hypothetical protein
LLILVELLTITEWVKMRGDFYNNSTNINKNHLSLQLIEWWSTIPPISTKITSHLNSLSDGQQFQEVMFVDIGGIVDHHSISWGERWFLLILVELLTITQWVEVRGDFGWYWWNCWPSLSTKIASHLNSLSDGQQFHQYQQKSPLTSTHWVMVNNSTNINKNHLSPQLIEWWWVEVRGDFCWYWWNCWPSLNELRWEVIFADIGGIVDHHSMSWGELWFLSSTHWVMVNNSTNINKNHLSPQLIEWWSTIPPISANITSHLNSLSDGQQFHQYQ